MLDLTKELPRPIRRDFLDNVLDKRDEIEGDLGDIPLEELENMLKEFGDDSANSPLNILEEDKGISGETGKWWLDKGEPDFNTGDKLQQILVAPYYLVKYVIKSIERNKITPENDLIPFMESSFRVFGLVGIASIMLMIYDLNFIVNSQQLMVSTLTISLVSKIAHSILISRNQEEELSELDKAYLGEDYEEEYEDYEEDYVGYDAEDEIYFEGYIGEPNYDAEDGTDEASSISRKKKEYSDNLRLEEHTVDVKISQEEYNNNLMTAFKNSAQFRNKNIVDREDIILSMNEYILCNNPGFSQLHNIERGSITYNNINFLIYEGLRGIYSQLTYTGDYVMDVQSVVENQLYYKVEVILPKVIKLDAVVNNIGIIESKFKAYEADNDVDIGVSYYGNIYVFRIKKVSNSIITWADAIRYYDPIADIKTYKQFIDEDAYDFPIMVGLQNDETPIIFDLSENTNIAVAGTSGSGKSWAVFLLIYNIIIQSYPGDANFIIFDFKGDIQYEAIARLPHVVGLFNHKDRPEMYIEYLKEILAEMNRRTQLLNRLGVSKWSELRKNLKDQPDKLREFPWLFVVMEETAAVLSALESASKRTELRDDYIRITKEIAKQCRSIGIRIIMISQRTTDKDLPRDIESECGVKFTFKLKKADLDRVEMMPTGIIPPKKKGTAVFKEEFLSEPIIIKSLGIGGMNDLQIQNLTRMMAFEWHLRIEDSDIENKYPLFKLVDNRMERRRQVLQDLEEGNFFTDPRTVDIGAILGIDTPKEHKNVYEEKTKKKVDIHFGGGPDVIDLDKLYEEIEEEQEEQEDEYKQYEDYIGDLKEEPVGIIEEELTEADKETSEIASKIIKKAQTRPIVMMGNTGGKRTTINKDQSGANVTSKDSSSENRIKKYDDIGKFIRKYGETQYGAAKVSHEMLEKYYTKAEIDNALNNIYIVDLDGYYVS